MLLQKKLVTALALVRESGVRGLARYAARRYKYPLLRVALAASPGRAWLKWPHIVQIEVSSRCNLHCPACSVSRESGQGRNLTVADFTAIVDCLPFRPLSVSLNGLGEPLANPDFLAIVDALAARGIDCSFYTNGTLLGDWLAGELVRRSNISFVGISCDGATPSSFERLRRGARFEAWIAGVSGFVTMARASAARPIKMMMSTVVSRDNHKELKDLVRLAAALGFNHVQFAEIVPHDDQASAMRLDDVQFTGADQSELLRVGQDLRIEVGFVGFGNSRPGRLNCLQPWEYVQITTEGNVLPCCVVVGSAQAAVMGNIHEACFEAIWHGQAFNAFREGSARGTQPLCARCPYH